MQNTTRTIHSSPNTILVAIDAPGPGNACHIYEVRNVDDRVLARIEFQKGPIGEAGVNGIQHDDLLRIIQDRLDGFQSGPYQSPGNEVTAGFISAALASDGTRTRRRVAAGTEGTSQK